jgi:uncharacterized protein
MLNSYTKLTDSHMDKVLYKLCKHFALKIPVEFDSEKAHIEFSMGICQIRREQDTLHLQCQADASDKLAAIESIVGKHLALMAKNPELVLQWQPLGVEPCQG